MLNYQLYQHAWVYGAAPDEETELAADDCKKLLEEGGLLVRNVFDFDQPNQTNFWYLIKDSFGGLYELKGHSTRHRVRKSLELNEFKIVDKTEFDVMEAYRVMLANYQIYKYKSECPSFESLQKRIRGLASNYDLWEGRDKSSDKMVAWSIVRRVGSCAEYQTVKGDPAFFRSSFPFYGIYHICNEHYLERLKLSYVSDGSRSVTNHSNIQQFLEEKFRFRKAYCNVRITYRWWMKLAVTLLFPIRRWLPETRVRALLMMEEMQR